MTHQEIEELRRNYAEDAVEDVPADYEGRQEMYDVAYEYATIIKWPDTLVTETE